MQSCILFNVVVHISVNLVIDPAFYYFCQADNIIYM